MLPRGGPPGASRQGSGVAEHHAHLPTLASSRYRTRGPIERQEPFKGRALFIFDPDGNETEVNTRYLYRAPLR